MNPRVRLVGQTVTAVGLSVAAFLVFVGIFSSPTSKGLRNQRRLVTLLSNARAVPMSENDGRIQGVALSDKIILAPEQEKVVWGYGLVAHVRTSHFTVEARPTKVGKTGIFSFFRDEGGVVRFEPELGKSAGAESRVWGQPSGQ